MGIVVTGVGVVSALGIGVDQNLAAIRRGESGISASPSILQTSNQLPVGELRISNEELHQRLGISPKEHLSRTALLGILAVKEAMACVDIDFSKRIGLVSSTSVGGMDLTEHFFESFMEDDTTGRLRDVRMHDCAASTEAIARHCGINGYRTTISTACSSAANAVIAGAKLLKHNIVDYVIVGGSDALSAFTLNGFKSLMILDQKPCRPFDATRAGLNLGEGAGYIVLQREQDVDSYYCRLGGCSNRNDAHHQTASSAEGNGAFLAMSEALQMGGLAPEQVSYINAHGTGTGNNDASESAAFVRLFGDKMPPFSSTKGFTGHTLAAAGGVEAVFSVLAIKLGCRFPNLNFTTPIPEYGLIPVAEFEEGVVVDSVLTNSFGFGGNCSSLLFTR
jgi:3-oxoacyl-[acyl-carrier-protein] synthase-1